MPVRGIRGATVVGEDTPILIIAAARELLETILNENPDLDPVDIASVIFTVTDDLNSAYPARAAREMGWGMVPLLCTREIPVPGGLEKCIRVLLYWNTLTTQDDVRHVYLGEAKVLRPDLSHG